MPWLFCMNCVLVLFCGPRTFPAKTGAAASMLIQAARDVIFSNFEFIMNSLPPVILIFYLN
jgi:hypothetical protein